jgi:fatty acid desaturase
MTPGSDFDGRSVALPKADLRRLSRLQSWRGLSLILFQWGVIFAAILIAAMVNWWPVYLLAIIVIATRQHALAVLMHDAAHYLLHRNKEINSVVSNVFLSFPLLISTHRYRVHHLLHHRYLNTDLDPDKDDRIGPGSRRKFYLLILADLVGISAMRTLTTMSLFGVIGPMFKPPGTNEGLPRLERRLAFAFYTTVPVTIAAFGIWKELLIFWVLPMMTVLTPILRFRGWAEHGACADSNQLDGARSVDAGLFERFLLAPCNVHFHLEHHLYPSVPCYNLPELSAQLLQQENYREHAHLNAGYLSGNPSVLDDLLPVTAPAPGER